MKKVFLFALPALLMAAPSWAQAVKISKDQCAGIVRYQPQPGVAYTPGLDVYGRKLDGGPADMASSSPIKVPGEITFSMGMDLARKYGGPDYTGESSFGRVTVKSGRVYWNGAPLDGGDQAAIAAECERAYGK